MAFLREHSPAHDKGRWYQIGEDPDNNRPIKVKLRRLPESTARSISEKYGADRDDPVEAEGGGGKARFTVRRRVHSLEDMRAISIDRCLWAWLDCQNLSIEPLDDDVAKRYSEMLGGDAQVKANEPTILDGRLTAPMKQYLLGNFDKLRRAIDEKVTEHAQADAAEEVALAKN